MMKPRVLPLAALALLGCGAAEHTYVVPWLRVATEPRHVIAPHALEFGGGKRLELLEGEDWERLPHDGYSRVAPIGTGVVIEDGGGRGNEKPHDLFLYHSDGSKPIRIAAEDCASPYFGAAEIACFACGAGPTRTPLRSISSDEPCTALHIQRFDEYGKLLSERTVDSPIVMPDVEGQASNGDWILVETMNNLDFLFLYGPRQRFRLDGLGITKLPYGADPMKRDVDAEGAAKKILALAEQRETILPAMHAELDADEHDSALVKVDTLDNHIRKGNAISFQIKGAEPGTCFTMNARSTVEQIELAVHPGNYSSTLDPPLASALGAQSAKVTYCVGLTAADLQLSVKGLKGEGFVSVRLYKSSPR